MRQQLSTQEIEQWMTFYYQNPNPDITPIAIAHLSREGALKDEASEEQITIFLSFIFRNNPEKIEEWTSKIFQDLTSIEDKQVILTALWLSNTREVQEYLAHLSNHGNSELQEFIKEISGKTPPVIEEIPIDNPSVLDDLWAAFMATGEEKYVIRVISALQKHKNGDEEEDNKIIKDAVLWSLQSNINAHDKVKAICKNQLTKQPEEVATKLKKIV